MSPELVLIAAYLLVTLGIGLWAARYIHTLADYVLAGRNLPLWLVLPTTFALWFGAETVLGASHAIAVQGVGWDVLVDPVGAALCLVVYGLAVARPLYRTGNLTLMDFYADRYGLPYGVLAAFLNAPTYLFWVGGQLFALGLVLAHLFGIGFVPATVAGAAVIVVYTFRGGLLAITATEFLETIVIVASLSAVLLATDASTPGGLGTALEALRSSGGLDPFASVRAETSTTGVPFLGALEFLALLLAVGAGSLPSQDLYERANSSRTESVSAWGMIGGGLLYSTLALVPLALGVLARQRYPRPVLESMGEEMILHLIDDTGSTAVATAFYAALISALLSTASAAILAPSVLIGLNVIRPLRPGLDDRGMLAVTRWVVVGFSFVALLLALTEAGIHDLVEIASTLTLVSLTVPLLAGLYWKRASSAGAVGAMVGGLATYLLACALSIWQGSAVRQGFTNSAGYAWLVDVSLGGRGWLVPSLVPGVLASVIGMVWGSLAPASVQRRIEGVMRKVWERLSRRGSTRFIRS